MWDQIKAAAKAVAAFLYGGGSWIAATIPDLQHFGDVTAAQWLSAFLAGLLGAGLVWAVPNKQLP